MTQSPDRELTAPAGAERLHVRVQGGHGLPALLLVHGFLGSTRWFDRIAPLLLPHFRVVRVDLAGHGLSSDAGGGRSPADQAGFLRDVLADLGIAPAAAIGHSLGADVVVALAELRGGRAALIVLGEGPDYSVVHSPWINRLLRVPALGPLLYRNIPDSGRRAALRQFFAPGFPVETAFDDPDQPLRDARAVGYRTFVATQRGKERYVAEQGLHERIGRLGTRCLVLFGDRDEVFEPRESIRLYETVPGVRTVLLPGVGHSSMLEAPDAVAREVLGFLGVRGDG